MHCGLGGIVGLVFVGYVLVMGKAGAEAEDGMIEAPGADAYGYSESAYTLPPGPHLFTDWRYVYAMHIGYDAPRHGTPPDKLDVVRASAVKPCYGVRIERVVPQKRGPVLQNDRPWEFFTPYTVLLEYEGEYRLYYNTMPKDRPEDYMLCVATSKNGLDFEKPELGLVEFDGSKANNIVLGGHYVHGAGVFVDASAPPTERFKAIYQTKLNEEEMADLRRRRPELAERIAKLDNAAIGGAVSPDGLHWERIADPLMAHVSDTGTTAYYDEHLGRYVGYFRMGVMRRRGIGRAEAVDFRNWPKPELVFWPTPDEAPWVDYYTNGHARYPGSQTAHLMFPMIYERTRDSSVVRIATSLGGRHWDFIPGGSVLEPGHESAWESGCLFPGAGLVKLPDRSVAFPYVGFAVPHKFPRSVPLGDIGLAIWPSGRIASLTADDTGEFYTIPLKLEGDALYLNFETDRSGLVQVEICDMEGRNWSKCDPLWGDHLNKRVTWNSGEGDLKVSPDRPVTLRFRLRAARLYSFEVR